jgi:hypothetical protein
LDFGAMVRCTVPENPNVDRPEGAGKCGYST